MITWVGFLGKLLSFLATKLAGKAFDKLGDKKTIAAESLIRIYTAIAELEGITFEIMTDAKHAVEDGEALVFVSTICSKEGDIEAHTRNLVESFIKLAPVLEFFDPNLLEAIECICAWKYNILYEASRSMVLETEEGGHRLVRLRFKDPNDRLLDLDLEAHYRWIQTDPAYLKRKDQLERFYSDLETGEEADDPVSIDDLKNLEWPQKLLVKQEFSDIFTDSEIDLTISEKTLIKELGDKLEKHLSLLSAARANLKELIKEKLSIEDVLYISSKLDYRR